MEMINLMKIIFEVEDYFENSNFNLKYYCFKILILIDFQNANLIEVWKK